MLRKFTLVSLASAVALTLSQTAVAENMDNIRVHGFVNTASSVSNSSTKYVERIDSDGDVTATDYGLNVMAIIDQNLTIATQLHGTGLEGNAVALDWAFGRYKISDSIAAKAGRMKYTGNLISEYVNVAYAYPWIRAPEAIYSESADLFFESYNGAAAVFSTGDDTEYNAEIYGGEEIEEEGISHKQMMGLTLRAINDDYGELKLAYNRSSLLTADDTQNGKTKTYLSIGGKADWNQWKLLTEYVRSNVEGVPVHDSYGAFLTVGYKIGHTMPHLTYQKFDKNTGVNQSSWTLGVRHNLGSSTALKLEVQQVTSEGGNNDGGLFESQPAESRVNIVSAAVNFVF